MSNLTTRFKLNLSNRNIIPIAAIVPARNIYSSFSSLNLYRSTFTVLNAVDDLLP